MPIVQNAWTTKTVNGFLVLTCTFSSDASIKDTYTLKTPAHTVDGTKPFVMFLSAASAIDGEAVPLEIWTGYADDFAVTGAEEMAATHGAKYAVITDDCVAAITTVQEVFHIHPNLKVADVVTLGTDGYKINVPAAPYYAFAVNGGSAISADLVSCRIVQRQGV